MQRLSLFLIAALFIILAINSTKIAKADAELIINNNCGCGTATPIPTVSPTLQPTSNPSVTPAPSNPSTPPNGQVGAPICTASVPNDPTITSTTRKLTAATLTWTAVSNASYYLIFYGTKPGSAEFGVPNTGNVTTYTINALNPRLKYYFDVRAVNDCMPSHGSQVLGASTSVLAATSSDLILPRAIFGIIVAGVSFIIVKKYSI